MNISDLSHLGVVGGKKQTLEQARKANIPVVSREWITRYRVWYRLFGVAIVTHLLVARCLETQSRVDEAGFIVSQVVFGSVCMHVTNN